MNSFTSTHLHFVSFSDKHRGHSSHPHVYIQYTHSVLVQASFKITQQNGHQIKIKRNAFSHIKFLIF